VEIARRLSGRRTSNALTACGTASTLCGSTVMLSKSSIPSIRGRNRSLNAQIKPQHASACNQIPGSTDRTTSCTPRRFSMVCVRLSPTYATTDMTPPACSVSARSRAARSYRKPTVSTSMTCAPTPIHVNALFTL
jgi:hypothetical protein